jgi:hypothetical protein
MKLSIDTTNKVIQVEGKVNLLELTEALERMFPNGLWKTFSLETNTTIVWTTPIQIYPYYPYYPWWDKPVIRYNTGISGNSFTTGDVSYNLIPGIYNIEI